MPARSVPRETFALNREIRTRLGQRLRQHYDLAQRIPLSTRLAELAKQFEQTIEPEESNTEYPGARGP